MAVQIELVWVSQEEMPILPADHRSHLFPKRVRSFVSGVDDYAQQRGGMVLRDVFFALMAVELLTPVTS